MSEEKKGGLTRRDLMKTLGISGLAVAGLAGKGFAAGEAPTAEAKDAPMPRRKLGKTGAEVSALTLGGMFDTVNNQLLLKQALSWGITAWDTAEAYGNGLSEEGYGRFFSRNPEARKQIFLSTKLVAKGGKLSERLDAGLTRLKTDHADLFYIHSVTAMDELDGSLKEWVEAAKKAGKFRFFGFSCHGNMEDLLLGAAKLGWVDAVMAAYNFRLMHTDKMQAAVAACKQAGVGIVAIKTQGGGPVATETEEELKMAGRFLTKGFTDKQAKLKAVWEDGGIATICSQMPNLTILAANVAAARDKTSLSREDVASLQRFADASSDGYCAGCARICSAAVGGAAPVAEVMRAMMYHREYGEPGLAKQTFAALPEAVRSRLPHLDYTAAEAACPQGLAIAEIMKDAVKELA